MKLLFKNLHKSNINEGPRLLCLILFILFSSNFVDAQHLVWQKSLLRDNVNSGIQMKSMDFDTLHGFLVTGVFEGVFDFDPGAGLQNRTGITGGSVFILKLDPNGNFSWVRTLDNLYHGDYINGQFDSNGNSLFNGYCLDTLFNVNTGNGVINITNTNLNKNLILKLDSLGNYSWHQVVEAEIAKDGLDLDTANNIYLTGRYAMYSGMSVGNLNIPPVQNNVQPGDAYLAKLDSNGNPLWLKNFGEAGNLMLDGDGTFISNLTIAVTSQGKICLVGLFTDTVDFDLSDTSSQLMHSVPQKYHFFHLTMDSNGDFLNFSMHDTLHYYASPFELEVDNFGNSYYSANAFSFDSIVQQTPFTFRKFDPTGNLVLQRRSADIAFRNFTIDANQNIYTIGGLNSDTVDFDPGSGIEIFIVDSNAMNHQYTYILKLDMNGNFEKVYINKNEIGINGPYIGNNEIQLGNQGEMYTINYGITVGNIYKYHEDTCGFTSMISANQNLGCNQSGVISTVTTGGNPPFTYTWQLPLNNIDSATNMTATQGVQTVVITDSLGCSSSHSVLVNGPVVNSGFDATIHSMNSGFAPGFYSTIWVTSKNDGCQLVNGSYYVVLDTALQFISANPIPDQVVGDTLFWLYASSNYDSTSIETSITTYTPTWTNLGQMVTLKSSILPLTGDVNTNNNSEQTMTIVTASVDPNDITVYPQGKCDEGYIAPDQKLTYKIRFQNTGTADAINVFIIDSISHLLNLNTIRLLGASHPMHLEILPDGILKFVFNNIYLADSTSNEPESHGYVLFEIDPLGGLTQGMEISNHVGIYFDFNAPVYTNQVKNTIYEGDLNNLSCTYLELNEAVKQPTLLIHPNPTNNLLTIQSSLKIENGGKLHIMDGNGRLIESYVMDGNQKTLDVSNLETGMYFLIMEAGKQRIFGKFIKR